MLSKLDDWLTYVIPALWRQRYLHKLKASLVNIVIKLSYRAWSHFKKRKEGGRKRWGEKGKLLIVFPPKKKLHVVISTHRSLKLWNSIKGSQPTIYSIQNNHALDMGFQDLVMSSHSKSWLPGKVRSRYKLLSGQDSHVAFLYSKIDICY